MAALRVAVVGGGNGSYTMAGDLALAGHEVRTSLHLAMMVIDVLELLGLAGRAPSLGALVAEVRGRLYTAAANLEPRAR